MYSFAEVADSRGQTAAERLRNLIEEIVRADAVGLEVFGVGEHHRPDFAVSAPAVVLGAAAMRTTHIRLSSAVSVLSSDDPVRVFQSFATVDLLSGGRAEIMVGRGSFVESFPLFGYDLREYDLLFEEKLELLLQIRAQERVTWEGRHRAPLTGQAVYPRPLQDPLPIWVAVGGTPELVVRAARHGLPMALAIIGGAPAQFVPLVELYRRSLRSYGREPDTVPLSINSHTYVADTSQQARDEFYPAYAVMMNRIGRERGWPPLARAQFDALCGPQGALLVGSPQEVVDKILYEHELFGNSRFLAQVSVGPLPHAQVLHAIDLLGTQVAPAVRRALPDTP